MSRRTTSIALVVGLSLSLQGAALAQYRPPPMSDAERLIADGDEARVEAAKAASFGEKEKHLAKLNEAMKAYEGALAKDPKAVTAATGLALACAPLKDWDRIIKVLAPLQAESPADVDLAHLLGVALLKKARYSEAEALLAVAGTSDRADLFINQYYQGWLALQRGDGAVVVRELKRYLAQRPPEVAANDPDIRVMVGKGYLLLKDAPNARQAFVAAQGDRAEALGPQIGLAKVLLLEGKRPEAAKLLEGLNSRFPKSPEPKETLARLVLEMGNARRAESLTSELLRIQDSVAAHLLMADVQLALKVLPAAEREYRAVLAKAPNLVGAIIGLAHVLQAQGRNEPAIIGLAQASAARPDHPELLAALGTVYRRAGRFDAAVVAHQTLANLQPTEATPQLLLGADFFAASQWDKAVAAYTTVLDANPGHASATQWLAASLQRRAKARVDADLVDDAIRDLKRAYDLKHDVLTARSLGALLLQKGDFTGARPLLLEATALPGGDWREPYLAGWAALGLGDVEAATASFDGALAQAKDPGAQAQIGAAWALAKLETGDFDAAVKKLGETQGASKAAAENLPLALLRRGLTRLGHHDVSGAQADLDAAAKLTRVPAFDSLFELLRGFLAIEQNRTDLALAAFKKSVSPADKDPEVISTRGFLEAYAEYRRERTADAKKRLDVLKKATKRDAWPDFARANARRDGELWYVRGSMDRADRSFREALSPSDPANAYVVHNLACVQYRKGGAAKATVTWKALANAVPEATLNLGIGAQASRDPRRAASYYGQYLSTRGAHTGLAREWRDRIEAIYGDSGEAPQEETP